MARKKKAGKRPKGAIALKANSKPEAAAPPLGPLIRPTTSSVALDKSARWIRGLLLIYVFAVVPIGCYVVFLDFVSREHNNHVHIFKRDIPEKFPIPSVIRGTNSSTFVEGRVKLRLVRFDEATRGFYTELEFRTISSETLEES